MNGTRHLFNFAVFAIAVLVAGQLRAETSDDDDWPDWVEAEEGLRAQIAEVNEGELVFLANPPDSPVHHHHSHLRITEASLRNGWVQLEQCHHDLDRVPVAEILFHPQRSRALEVVSYRNIGSATAERHTVQLRDVGADSQICLRLETRALHPQASGIYELRNGPFMRRFLDGYYPMRVSLQIDFPPRLLLADVSPVAQPGFVLSRSPGRVEARALFEGRLHTRFLFLDQ